MPTTHFRASWDFFVDTYQVYCKECTRTSLTNFPHSLNILISSVYINEGMLQVSRSTLHKVDPFSFFFSLSVALNVKNDNERNLFKPSTENTVANKLTNPSVCSGTVCQCRCSAESVEHFLPVFRRVDSSLYS